VQVEAIDVCAQHAAALYALTRAGEVLRQRHAELDHGASPHRAEAHALRDGAFVAGGERGRVLSQRVVRLNVHESAVVEQAQDARVNLKHQTLDMALVRRRRPVEYQGPIAAADEPAVEANQMVVRIQVQAAAVALHEGDRPGFGVVHSLLTCESPQAPAQRASEDAMDRRAHRLIVGDAIAQRVRQAQHPLAHRHVR
jgi:hypothetical protein